MIPADLEHWQKGELVQENHRAFSKHNGMFECSLLILSDVGFSLDSISSYNYSIDFYTRVGSFLEHFDVSLDDFCYFQTKIHEKSRELL